MKRRVHVVVDMDVPEGLDDDMVCAITNHIVRLGRISCVQLSKGGELGETAYEFEIQGDTKVIPRASL